MRFTGKQQKNKIEVQKDGDWKSKQRMPMKQNKNTCKRIQECTLEVGSKPNLFNNTITIYNYYLDNIIDLI